jgi:predicted GNAT family acetyltransferase
MSNNPVTATQGDWHPAPRGLAFSDYGEWLDEGTTALIEDVAARAVKPATGQAAVPVPKSDCGIDIRHDEPQQMYGAWIGQEQIGYLTYKFVGNRVALWTTMVLPAYRKHGVATELVAKALDDIRSTGKTITVICPVVREVIDHYPQYRDLVDKVHPGVAPVGQA